MSAEDFTPGAPKQAPPELTLRPSPPKVTRLSRRALIVLAASASALVLGLGIWALDPPRLFSRGGGSELYNTDPRPSAEGLNTLPRDYASVPRTLPAEVPKLGPPLPGDLGRPILESQRSAGVQPPAGASQVDQEELRRLQEAEQARKSRVFFQTSTRNEPNGQQATPSPGPQVAAAPAASNLGALGVPPTFGGAGSGIAGGYGATTGFGQQQPFGEDPYRQNLQERKEAFLTPSRSDRETLSEHRMQLPVSRYQLMAGTILSAALITGLNSDLPGLVEAQVTEHVYDAVTGRHCLVPQGTRLLGRYDSQIAFGQSRALVAWTRLIRPDGSSVVLDRLPAADEAGYSGLEDKVDRHWERLIGAALLSTVIGAGAELGAGDDEDQLVRALRRGGQDSFNQTGQQITRRNLNIQPTITVRPGWPVRVIVAKDIVMTPFRGGGEGTCRS